ncbi:MAG: 7TMR-DISM family protein, partial [Ramlibacter sp.]
MTGQLIRRSWFVVLWLVLAAAGARAGTAPPPAPIVLSAGDDAIRLDGQAQFWVEPGRTRSIDEVAQAADLPWAALDLSRQHRLDGGALWIRFAVEQHDAERWYVALASSGIDRVQLFRRSADGGWIVDEAGDTRPVSRWPLPGRVPTFELHAGGGLAQYWLRVEHDLVDFAVPITLYSQGRLLAVREREQFLLGAYFGLSMLLALVSLFNAVGYRDRLFAVYAVYLVLFTLGQAAYLGVGAQHLWDPWLAWNAESTFLLPAMSAPAALWFVQVVTEPARFSRGLNLLVRALIVLLLLAALLDPVVHSRALMAGRLALTACSLVLVAVLIGLVWRKADDPDIRLIALGFVPVLVMAMFPVARGLNLIPNSIFTRYGLSMGAALEMPILFYALSRRGSRRRRAESR